MNIEKLIARAAQMISFGVAIEEIRGMLLGAGCSEEQAYLVYAAARVFARG